MKLTTFLFIVTLFQIQANESYAQRKKITLNLENVSVENVLNKIESLTEFKFFYFDHEIDYTKVVTIKAKNEKVSSILERLFANSNIKIEIYEKQIVLKKEDKAPIDNIGNTPLQKQEHTITGTIEDINGQPLPGASILEKGTSNGTQSDFDGNFSITVSDKNAVLIITYLGYSTKEIEVNGKSIINVLLSENAADLDEVVIVGYGTQKKESVVGAISTIKPSLVQVGTARTIGNNLGGQITGVIAVQRSGEPGYDASDIKIRGISTFAGGTNPLVLVDGIERNLNDVDPASIESFSVLKDAAASAVYGVRGANGVILVNTKRGFVGKPVIQIRTEHAIQEPTKLPNFISAVPYMNLINELAADSGIPHPFSEDRITKTENKYDLDLYPDINWIDAITKDYASTTRTSLNVAGGSDVLRYALTTSYYNERGILDSDPNQSYNSETRLNRVTVRTNVDINLSKTTLLRVNIGGFLQQLQKGDSSTDNLFNTAFETTPYVHPAIYSDGTIPKVPARPNPWAISTQQGYYRQGNSKIESFVALEQDFSNLITPGLKGKLVYSFDNYSENRVTRSKSPDYYNVALARDVEGNLIHDIQQYGQEFLGLSNSAGFGDKRIYLEASTTYKRVFGKHDFNGLLLYNQNSYDNGGVQPYRHQGLAGRISYGFDKKYIGEFNFGYNGSENFEKGKRFGFFPSVALGWIASEEKFMEPYRDVVNKLKLRASYGLVGNDNIGSDRRFAYQTTINGNSSGYNWGTGVGNYIEGIQEGEVGVAGLTWEKVAKTDIGLELGLWNMVDLIVDVFSEKRSDIFIRRNTVPTQAGFINTPFANFGKMNNKGVEVSLNLRKQITPNFYMSWRGNFTYVKNEIIERDEPAGVREQYPYKSGVGIQNNTLWGQTALGLYSESDFDPNTGLLNSDLPTPQLSSVAVRPGDIKYQDKNEDGVINALDEGFIGGTRDPQIIFGFGSTSKYKQFDLSFFFQGIAKTYEVIGQGGEDANRFIPGSGSGTLGNIYSNYNDRWTESNPSQDVFWPRLTYTTNTNNNVSSTWWKKDMSFVRLKSLEIGYSLTKSAAEKIKLGGLRMYVSGNNLFYISKFKLWDPELDTRTGLRYPSTKSILFGLDISL
ncbi:TonB-dependent receptor [Flavivirga sp. 57AJ16]|uniref:SusC/RagA family TonB-linked outer membrane protein n=1 Tax=Flavivirga sp. 57AJ16 TaxID=3025307 RepID=UPI002366A265|nr:TonB-dependent receptor [Flavivirga sp. 57AJ16]MDD7885390.1 TonB-dependent receptor [Flavivirga sp. 57AJ16]